MVEEIAWVEHDGLRFRCSVNRTRADAPWIVFCNSIMTDLNVWDAQAALLAGHYNVLRYDQRGHGQTSVPSAPCDFAQLGGDLLALLDHFSIARATLVGLSMGVPTVLFAIQKRPHLVERLVLSDGQSATAPGGADAWQQRIDRARDVGMEVTANDTMDRWFSDEFRASERFLELRTAAAAVPLEGYVACVQALQNYNFTDVLPGIEVPCLILVGSNDGNMPVSMRHLNDAISGSEMHIIPDAGHIPCCEQAADYNQHLSAFLGL